MKKIIIAVILILSAGLISFRPTPSVISVQGIPSYLPNVSGMTDPGLPKSVICNPKWKTSFVRPPTSYTNAIKRSKLPLGTNMADVELDHDIPLAIGGHPKSPDNLWPEPWDYNLNGKNVGAHTKDRLEVKLHSLICSGKIEQITAQKCIADNWIDCYKKYIGDLPDYK